ncbi:PorP/SprF family type IX secretion system membrane protein [Aquirufa sp. ROCK2-A2]
MPNERNLFKKSILSLLSGLFILMYSLVSYGQQDPGLSMYSFNTLHLNPAFAGLQGESFAQVHYRNQWTQYQSTYDGSGNLGTQMAGVSLPLSKINGGVSLAYMSDNTPSGVGQQFIQLQFAKHFQMGSGTISGGIRLGLHSKSFDGRVYKPRDSNDPIIDPLLGKAISQSLPNVGIGLLYSLDNFRVGINADHLNSPNFTFQSSASNVLRPVFTLHTSMNVYFSSFVELEPFAQVRYYSSSFLPEMGARVKLFDAFWVGGSYRLNDAVIGMLGVSVFKQKLDIGYSLDNTLVNATVKAPLSHEIFIKFNLPSFKGSSKGIPIKTPRFKIL